MSSDLSHPHLLQVDFLPADSIMLPGRLGIALPAGQRASANEHRQGLQKAELQRLKIEYAVDTLVSLLSTEEFDALQLDWHLQAEVTAAGLQFLHFPIEEGGVLTPEHDALFRGFIKDILGRLERCETVVLHCRSGCSRSAMVAACVLVSLGLKPADAVRTVRATREGLGDLTVQEAYVEHYARKHQQDTEQLLGLMMEYFVEDEWVFNRDGDDTILYLNVTGKSAEYRCVVRTIEDAEQVTFYSMAPIKVPEDKRLAVAEYITRANYGLRLGNLEMDYSDGEIRYKTSIDVEGGELTKVMIKNLIHANLSTMDRYMPGLMRVVYGGASPLEAVQSIEGA